MAINNLMMTFDDAISQLDDLIGDANTHCEEDGTLDEVFRRDIQALRMGITALKAVKGGGYRDGGGSQSTAAKV